MRYRKSAFDENDSPDEYGVKKGEIIKWGLIALGILVVGTAGFVWFVCRIEIPGGYFVPLLKKTGQNMDNVMVLATSDFKGPQFELLKEGRHFRNPYHWGWTRPEKATVIEQLQVGVMTRRHGKPLPSGAVVAREEDQKGIVPEVLMPGRHYVNRRQYDVEVCDMINIKPGYMGIITLLVGREPADANVFVVNEGERGTQSKLLLPGVHERYSNPYVHMVTSVDVRSQKFEMADEFAVIFPSKDGFDIRVEGTIEWAPNLKKLPELFVKYVDEEDMQESGGINNIQRKVILPFARAFFRTIGGQYHAVDYITGNTRTLVQRKVSEHLQKQCKSEGIEIRSFVIRSTEPPEQIRDQYKRREIAQLQNSRYAKEIITEIGNPVMVDGKAKIGPDGEPVREGGRLAKIIQERKKDRASKLGEVRIVVRQAIREAGKYEKVEVTKAQAALAVAKVMLEAAKDRAAQVRAKGEAQAAVTVMKYKAEAEAIKAKIQAFGQGEQYAEYQLITKLAPGIRKILSNTEGLFAELFERFVTIRKDRKK